MINKCVLCLLARSCRSLSPSGWFDPLIQNLAYVQFATNAPGYGQLQDDTVLAALNQSFFGPGGCQEQELACYAAGESDDSNTICRQADNFCVSVPVPRCRVLTHAMVRFETCSRLLSEIAIPTICDKQSPPPFLQNST